MAHCFCRCRCRCRCRRDDLRSLLSEAMNTTVFYDELAGGLEPIRNSRMF